MIIKDKKLQSILEDSLDSGVNKGFDHIINRQKYHAIIT